MHPWRFEGEILWYFSAGQSAFERSTFGAQIERLAAQGVDSRGERVPTRADKAKRAWEFQDRRLRAGRPVDPTLAALQDAIPWDELDPSETAAPRPTRATEPSVSPNDAVLVRYAQISRALTRIAHAQQRALGLFYGNRGGYWALRCLGRVMAVLPETASGARLLRDLPGAGDMRPDERIAGALAKQLAVPEARRGALLRAAEREALEAVSQARRSYGAARNG